MNKKTVSISLPQIEGVELKSATVDLEKGVVVAEYGEEDIEKDISEIVVDFADAIDYLHEDRYIPDFLTTEKHMPKLEAFNKLLMLAEAWNKFDEFEIDWDDLNQEKHYPFFEFIDGKFEFSNVRYVQLTSDTHTSNFSFRTPERAEQFGKKFIDLFRIVLTN